MLSRYSIGAPWVFPRCSLGALWGCCSEVGSREDRAGTRVGDAGDREARREVQHPGEFPGSSACRHGQLRATFLTFKGPELEFYPKDVLSGMRIWLLASK